MGRLESKWEVWQAQMRAGVPDYDVEVHKCAFYMGALSLFQISNDAHSLDMEQAFGVVKELEREISEFFALEQQKVRPM